MRTIARPGVPALTPLRVLVVVALALAVGVGLVALLGAVLDDTRSVAAGGAVAGEQPAADAQPGGTDDIRPTAGPEPDEPADLIGQAGDDQAVAVVAVGSGATSVVAAGRLPSPAPVPAPVDQDPSSSTSTREPATNRPLPVPPQRPGGPTTMQVTPQVLSADSTDEELTFTFTAGSNLRGALDVSVPAGWSAPQVDDEGAAGWVAASSGGCQQVGAPSVSGDGPWTVSVDLACTTGRSMTLVYGAGGSLLPATTAGEYTFATSLTGARADAVAVQPMVRVAPGAPAVLRLDHVDTATAGQTTDLSLLVQDQFGNTATGYTGTVSITSTDPEATVPEPVAFGPTDAGTVSLSGAVTHRTAAAQTLTASDASNDVLTDSVEVAVAPGEVAQLFLRGDGYYALSDVFLPLPSPYIPSARDEFGNAVTAPYDVRMSVSPGAARLSGAALPSTLSLNRTDGEIAFPTVQFGTPGPQRLTIELVGDPEITASIDVVVWDGRTSELKVEDPYLTGETRIRVNPLAAWLTDMPGGAIAPTAQPTFIQNGVTYQLGELSTAPEGRDLVWDLDPAEGTLPAVPSHTLLRCDGEVPCAVGGELVGASGARYAYTFPGGRNAFGGLDLEIVGEGRDVTVAPPALVGEIPFDIGPLGLTASGAFVPWNGSLTVTSVVDMGLVSEVGVLVPQPSGVPIPGTVDLFSSADLVTGAQLVLEQPLEVVSGQQPTFSSVRILDPPPSGQVSTTPQLTLQTAIMFNFSTDVLPDGRIYTSMPTLVGLIDSPTGLGSLNAFVAGLRWPDSRDYVVYIRNVYEVSSPGCIDGLVIAQSIPPGTTIVRLQEDQSTLRPRAEVDVIVCRT